MTRVRRVRIFTEGVRVAIGEDFHQPAVKIIHRVVHDGFEAAIVFPMSLFNVVFQTDADVSVFAAQPDLLGPKHLDVLHRNFGNAVGAAVQFLLFRRQAVDIELFLEVSPRSGLDQFELGFFFKRRSRGRLHSWSWRGAAGHGCWRSRHWALPGGSRLGRGAANQIRNLRFQRRTRTGLERQSNKSRQDFQGGGERGSGSLCAKQGRKRVRRLVAGASGDHVVDGVMKFVGRVLDALEVIAKRPRNGLLDRVELL